MSQLPLSMVLGTLAREASANELAANPGHVGSSPGKTIRQDFESFNARHPEVYRELVELARRAKARGARRMGLKALFEIVRWNRLMTTTDWAGFKLNNSYTALYARLIMENEPDLDGFFETRRLHVVEDAA